MVKTDLLPSSECMPRNEYVIHFSIEWILFRKTMRKAHTNHSTSINKFTRTQKQSNYAICTKMFENLSKNRSTYQIYNTFFKFNCYFRSQYLHKNSIEQTVDAKAIFKLSDVCFSTLVEVFY